MILWEWKTRKNATVWNIRFRLIRTIFDNFIFEFNTLPWERESVCVCPRALVCLFCYSNAFILLYLSLKKTFFSVFFFVGGRKKVRQAFIPNSGTFHFFFSPQSFGTKQGRRRKKKTACSDIHIESIIRFSLFEVCTRAFVQKTYSLD